MHGLETIESVSSRMKFGLFMAPYHGMRSNPTLDLEQDLQLVEYVENLGYDEVYFGEHHSAGFEIYGSPEVMIASAIPRTRRITLGSGVVSVSYHHPFMVAERFVMLDHLSRGRVVLGVGPGALPSDTEMFAIPYVEVRERLETAVEAIIHLLTSDEPLTVDAGWFRMVDAKLNLKPYTRPMLPMVVPALASPSGPRLGGRFGLPLMSLAATSPESFAVLAEQWQILEQRSAEFGHPAPRRADWSMVAPMHLAETREQAEADVQYGIDEWGSYQFRNPVTFGAMAKKYSDPAGHTSVVDIVRRSGMGVVGTPEDAIALIDRLQQQSGGFGKFLLLAHNWANPAATRRSYELFAQYVFPYFQDQLARKQERWAQALADVASAAEQSAAAIQRARAQHEAEMAGSRK